MVKINSIECIDEIEQIIEDNLQILLDIDADEVEIDPTYEKISSNKMLHVYNKV